MIKSNNRLKKVFMIIMLLVGGISATTIINSNAHASNEYPPMTINNHKIKMNENAYKHGNQLYELDTTKFDSNNEEIFNIHTKANAKLHIDTNNKHQYFYKVYKPSNGNYHILVKNLFVKEGGNAPITFFTVSPSYSKMIASVIDITPTNNNANYNG